MPTWIPTADDYTEIDVTLVSALQGTITLGAADVTVGPLSVLGQFSITLDDINSDPAIDNELAGQTIRFSTAAQAERAITVTGPDNDAGGAWVPGSAEYFERDTNVIWLFNTITGTATAGQDRHVHYGPRAWPGLGQRCAGRWPERRGHLLQPQRNSDQPDHGHHQPELHHHHPRGRHRRLDNCRRKTRTFPGRWKSRPSPSCRAV